MTVAAQENHLATSRARRLRAATHDAHERLDHAIMAAASFATLAGYRRFVQVQHRFHGDIARLYGDARLATLLPGLPARARLAAVAADLADLHGTPLPEDTPPVFASDAAVDVPTALGWLYVAEGSNLGAALLRREAAALGYSDAHGARHLAPAPEGPAAQWRAFAAGLDATDLTAAEDRRVVAGAIAAFDRVGGLLARAMR